MLRNGIRHFQSERFCYLFSRLFFGSFCLTKLFRANEVIFISVAKRTIVLYFFIFFFFCAYEGNYAEALMNNRADIENPYCESCGVALYDRWDYKGQRKDHFPDCPRRYEKSNQIEKPSKTDHEEKLKRNHQNLVRFLGFMALSLFSVVSK